jgi:hypothetical protein
MANKRQLCAAWGRRLGISCGRGCAAGCRERRNEAADNNTAAPLDRFIRGCGADMCASLCDECADRLGNNNNQRISTNQRTRAKVWLGKTGGTRRGTGRGTRRGTRRGTGRGTRRGTGRGTRHKKKNRN